jgi:mono/diheme cytochrome c family protein
MEDRIRPYIASAFAALAMTACAPGRVPLPELRPAVVEDTSWLAARGEYIVRSVSICGHCHATDPREPDGPLGGGFAFRNWRLGTVRASNLTPDPATGLGEWTAPEIVRAIRNGVDRHDRVLAPVMPYHWFSGMTEGDALAVATYLATLDPVQNVVRQNHNIIYAIGELLFLRPEEARDAPAPQAGATAEYGEYLARHVALCADCHTPRSGIRAEPQLDRLFAGTADPPDGFPANPANLTPDSATGIGLWSEADFLAAIRTGVNPAGAELHPFMPWRQFRRMNDDDLRAIYRYLRTVRPIRNEVPERTGR